MLCNKKVTVNEQDECKIATNQAFFSILIGSKFEWPNISEDFWEYFISFFLVGTEWIKLDVWWQGLLNHTFELEMPPWLVLLIHMD